MTAQQADSPTLPPPVAPGGFRGVQPTPINPDLSARTTPSPSNTPQPQPLGWHTIFAEGFDTGSPQRGWVIDPRPYLSTNGGNARLHLAMPRTLPLGFGYVHDSHLQAKVQLLSGSLLLGARSSDLGHYVAEFRADGIVSLFRYETLLASTTLPQDFSDETLIGIRVIDNRISATVNNVEVLAAIDDNPLPYGVPFIESKADAELFIDDVLLEGTINESPDVRISPRVQISGRSKLYDGDDYLSRENGCNLDGRALLLTYRNSDRRDVFFGTIANASTAEVCKFFDFKNTAPSSTYLSRPVP